MNEFISGALMMGHLVAALLFLKFWRRTHDKLFVIFAVSFFLLGAERIVIFYTQSNEYRPYVYIIRLVAFCLIIFAFLDKNRKSKPLPKVPSGRG